jgi:hypothetical protein
MLDTADSASPNLLSPENGVPVDVESVRNHLSENATSVDARVRYSTKTYRDLTRVIYVRSRHHTYEEVLIGASSTKADQTRYWRKKKGVQKLNLSTKTSHAVAEFIVKQVLSLPSGHARKMSPDGKRTDTVAGAGV